ncbi:MAG: FliM/FliN family flagellar motor switch protein [Deltaproteobacteria bacterium]|nr:FliM/FliN family flagellar motor switch protein [Deltaproteobacteria bacterium]
MVKRDRPRDEDELHEDAFDDDGATDIQIPDLIDEADDEPSATDPERTPDEALSDLSATASSAPPARSGTRRAATRTVAGGVSKRLGEAVMGMAADVPVQVVAVLGKKTVTMHELFQLEVGQLIEMGVPLSVSVDLVANGKLIAKGELVEIDGQLGVKVVKLIR